jgi:HEAT repeat protein
MRFDASRAAPALLEQLATEVDGVVRYKLLRALGKLRVEHPTLKLDGQVIEELIGRTVSRMYELVEWRAALEAGTGDADDRKTDAQQLLVQLLLDKETNGIERLFRLIGLGYDSENVETLYRGLRSRRPAVRASSRELLESLLSGPLQEAVLGLVDEAPAKVRLSAAGPFHQPVEKTYETALQELIEVDSESIRSLAMYHAAELGLSRMQAHIEATLDTEGAPASRRIRQSALDLLLDRPKLVGA